MAAASSARTPPWEQQARDAPALALAEAAFGRWLVARPSSARGMRASKFERRVLDVLGAVGVAERRVVREVVLPVGADLPVRRFLDDPSESFQRGGSVALRLDFAWADDDGRTLMVVEVDGAQHGRADHFFGSSRAVRRDALKDRLLAEGARQFPVRFLRLGPEFQRDTHAVRTELVRRLLAFVRAPVPAAAAFALSAAAPLPDPDWCAARRRRMRARSASLPLPGPSLAARRAAEEEVLRKLRTAYTRSCRERAAGDPARLEALRRRQAASDSRKRPRDDAFHPYDPRWFARAYRASPAAAR
jgi:hypothetical protein